MRKQQPTSSPMEIFPQEGQRQIGRRQLVTILFSPGVIQLRVAILMVTGSLVTVSGAEVMDFGSAVPMFRSIWLHWVFTPNFTYTFVQDMKIVSGTDIGGIKIESWGPSGKISDSGDLRPSLSGHNTANWETYYFSYTIDPAATGLKIVPLWGPNSSVAYDNMV